MVGRRDAVSAIGAETRYGSIDTMAGVRANAENAKALEELEARSQSLFAAAGYGHRSHPDRSLRRARARILHRPRLRGRADLRGQGRGRPAGPLRLGRRRRALRRARRPLPRRAGSRDRLFDRRLAPARGFAGDQEPDRRGGRDARPCRRARARPRRSLDGELSAPRREPAPGGDRGRALSGLEAA